MSTTLPALIPKTLDFPARSEFLVVTGICDMSESAEINQNERAQKPNGADKWNATILTITMIAVVWYAYEAHKQSALIANNVAQEVMINRAVVIPNGVEWVNRKGRIPIEVHVKARNFGRSMALSVTMAGEIALRTPNEPPPFDPRCGEDKDAPTDLESTPLAAIQGSDTKDSEPNWFPAAGENVDEAETGKLLYAVGCVWYRGLDRQKYFTDICTYWVPDRPQDFRSCPQADRNQVH
jgi:hypothetical protein